MVKHIGESKVFDYFVIFLLILSLSSLPLFVFILYNVSCLIESMGLRMSGFELNALPKDVGFKERYCQG